MFLGRLKRKEQTENKKALAASEPSEVHVVEDADKSLSDTLSYHRRLLLQTPHPAGALIASVEQTVCTCSIVKRMVVSS